MKTSIVLIGMPYSGKTTIGKQLASKLHLSHVDLDEYITAKKGFNIDTIVNEEKLKEFRTLESETLNELSSYDVISLGGGTILVDNIKEFVKDKVVIYLDVYVDVLKERADKSRPLLNHITLQELYDSRVNIYHDLANKVIKNNNINDTIEVIIDYIDEVL